MQYTRYWATGIKKAIDFFSIILFHSYAVTNWMVAEEKLQFQCIFPGRFFRVLNLRCTEERIRTGGVGGGGEEVKSAEVGTDQYHHKPRYLFYSPRGKTHGVGRRYPSGRASVYTASSTPTARLFSVFLFLMATPMDLVLWRWTASANGGWPSKAGSLPQCAHVSGAVAFFCLILQNGALTIKTLKCCFDVGPTSKTVGQNWIILGQCIVFAAIDAISYSLDSTF